MGTAMIQRGDFSVRSRVLPLESDTCAWSRMLSEIDEHARAFTVASTLLLEGEESKAMLLVTEGWLCLSKSLVDGQTQIIDFALPGDIIDPSSADGLTAPISVEAMTAASVAAIPFQRWEELLGGHPIIRRRARAITSARQARRAERTLRLGKGTAETRLAYALLELCLRIGSVDICDGAVFHLPLTQQQLGDFIGLSSVHVCRTMCRMARKKILERADQMNIRVLDAGALANLAGVDAATLSREIIPRWSFEPVHGVSTDAPRILPDRVAGGQ